MNINNTSNAVEKNHETSILNQRNKLLRLNPDLVFWVYNIDNFDDHWYDLSVINEMLTCYPNQLDNLNGLDQNSDITIVNLWALRKWKIEVISWKDILDIDKPVLLSNGVLDYIESYSFIEPAIDTYKKMLRAMETIFDESFKNDLCTDDFDKEEIKELCAENKKEHDDLIHSIEKSTKKEMYEELTGDLYSWIVWSIANRGSDHIDDLTSMLEEELWLMIEKIKVNKHFITTLRDWWAADNLMRTTTAWRNTWEDLNEEIEVELMWEAPFLWKNKKWEYVLAVHSTSDDKISFLEESVTNFIERKHLSNWDDNYNEKKKLFERNFKWVNYNNLPKILSDIIENKRFLKYDLLDWNIDWTEDWVKNIRIWKSSWDYYVFHDKENNTIEYRAVKKIWNFDENFVPLWRKPWRLYLESENQYPRVPRVENAWRNIWNAAKLVPTVQSVVDNIHIVWYLKIEAEKYLISYPIAQSVYQQLFTTADYESESNLENWSNLKHSKYRIILENTVSFANFCENLKLIWKNLCYKSNVVLSLSENVINKKIWLSFEISNDAMYYLGESENDRKRCIISFADDDSTEYLQSKSYEIILDYFIKNYLNR